MAMLFSCLLGFAVVLLLFFIHNLKSYALQNYNAMLSNEITLLKQLYEHAEANAFRTYLEENSQQDQAFLYHFQTQQTRGGNFKRQWQSKLSKQPTYVLLETDAHHLLMAKYVLLGNQDELWIARDIQHYAVLLQHFKYISIVIFLLILIVILVSFFISRFVVTRINVIANTARDIINTGDLSRRISITTEWDDLSNLAHILNNLLTKIENLIHGIRDVSNNIAHDLRTPLMHLRSRLEETKSKSSQPDMIDELLSYTDGILRTFSALMRIAKLEKASRQTKLTQLDLMPLISDVVELYEPVAHEKYITINNTINQACFIVGDRDLLFQALTNLLDNAIKFSTVDSSITLSHLQTGNYVTITLSDNGCGIDAIELDRVFERFYRGDKSRHTPGSGLGLSLVKAIINTHHAQIYLSDNNPGLRVDLVFYKG